MPETFSLQAFKRPLQLLGVIADHMRSDLPVGPAIISLLAYLFGQVKDNSLRQAVIFPVPSS